MNRRGSAFGFLTIGIFSMAQLSGCAFLQYWPKFDEAKLQPAVVSGYVVTARYLKDPPCFLKPEELRGSPEEIVICMDPAPIALTFQIDQVLYGHVRSSRATVVTTSHYGT